MASRSFESTIRMETGYGSDKAHRHNPSKAPGDKRRLAHNTSCLSAYSALHIRIATATKTVVIEQRINLDAPLKVDKSGTSRWLMPPANTAFVRCSQAISPRLVKSAAACIRTTRRT